MTTGRIELDSRLREKILKSQKGEITEHVIYLKLSESVKDDGNSRLLKQIASDELRHYMFWKNITETDLSVDWLKVWWYYLISRIFGISFGLKLMERGEENAQEIYGEIVDLIPDVRQIIEDEEVHEERLLDMLDEDRLRYVGSVVLGLNDALVELTAALVGFSFAFQDTKMIAAAGLITGIAASLSMASSEYLSSKTEGDGRSPLKASAYTGSAYIFTVLFIIFPYFLFDRFQYALVFTLINAVAIIAVFTYYVSVVKNQPFAKRFAEMTAVSLGVSGLTFLIGVGVRSLVGVDI